MMTPTLTEAYLAIRRLDPTSESTRPTYPAMPPARPNRLPRRRLVWRMPLVWENAEARGAPPEPEPVR